MCICMKNENFHFGVSFLPSFCDKGECRETPNSLGKVHSETAPKIVQPSENKLFSEKVGKKAVLAAYRVRGLFLCGQIAYGKRCGIVHSSENENISENSGQIRSPAA